jgi:predicted 3-demethylubiquinone-9 3-methyltransferase (glyoxalase superfamily)
MQSITPFLWFDTQAEEAAQLYTSVFKNSKILTVSRYTEAGKEVHGKEPGSAMVVDFELNGQRFQAINGGPHFTFSPAISFMVTCENQEEVDYYWEKLSEGGAPEAQQCGWLADKFGLSWQIIPKQLGELMSDPDPVKAGRTMEAMLKMKKIDIAELQKAHDAQ